jgi:hypothetical protein
MRPRRRRRDACELMLFRFVAQLKLRRHADLGGDVALLGLLVPRGSTGGAGEGGPPPWVIECDVECHPQLVRMVYNPTI